MIHREDHDDVAVIRIEHGPVGAMDTELCTELASTLRSLVADPAQAVVLTGTGGSFSAGVDLNRIVEGGADYVQEFFPALSELFAAAFALGKPLVAAVNGHAIAGGCVLAAAADVVLMAEGKAGIGLPELKVGVPFPRIALEVVGHRVGEVVLRRMVVGATTYKPEQARDYGLVDDVVPADELAGRALTAAAGLAAQTPSDTFAATKAALRHEATERAERFAEEDATATLLWARHATDGTIAGFMESVARR
jgi:enoyl-CoA hydratase